MSSESALQNFLLGSNSDNEGPGSRQFSGSIDDKGNRNSPTGQGLDIKDLKDEQTERVRLDKSNFELKMKALYLEDKIKRSSSSDSSGKSINNVNSGSSHYRDNVDRGGGITIDNATSLRLALEEKDIVIDQKNNLLIKAKQIISQLESELDRLRLMEDVKTSLEDRLQRLKGANDDIENEYRRQISELELQLNQARQSSISKEELKNALADKLAHLEIANSELQEKNAVSREENSRENERNHQLQQRNKDLDYELSQLRARCEIYEMQVYEMSGELEKEKMASKEQQATHNRVLDELKGGSLRLGADKEGLELRYRALEVRYRELEVRCRDFDEVSDKYAEVKGDLLKAGDLCAELRDMLRKEQTEKANSISRAEQLSLALESAKTAMKEQNTTLSFADEEVKRLSVDNIELNKKVNVIADISRENEKLKSSLTTHTRELAEAMEKLKALQETLSDTRQELITKGNLLTDQQVCISSLENEKRNLQNSLESQRRQLAAQDADLDELRSLTVSLRHEVDAEKDRRALQERAHAERVERMVEIANACILSCTSMQSWDTLLDDVLDGDLFASIFSSIASNSLQQNVVVNNSDDFTGRASSNNKHDLDWKKFILEDSSYSSSSRQSADTVTRHVASLVETVQQKMKRVAKIRALFASQSQKMAELVLKQVTGAQQKATLVTHEVAVVQKRVDSISAVVTRDKKYRDEEMCDMKKFREDVIVDFSSRLRGTELKLSDATKEAETERLLRSKMGEERDHSQSLVSGFQSEVTQLKLELSRYENYETVVAEITARFNEITENNRLMQKESEFKTEQIREMQQMNKDLNTERIAANQAVENLKHQMHQVEEKLLESQNIVQTQAKEIAFLQSRQIDPSLLLTIQRTQAMMANNQSPAHHGHHATSSHNRAKDDQQFRALNDIIASVSELSKESQNIVKQFEISCDNLMSYGNSYNPTSSPNPNLNDIKGDIFELLDENSRLLTLLNQTAGDLRKYFRKHELAKDGVGDGHHLRSRPHHHPYHQRSSLGTSHTSHSDTGFYDASSGGNSSSSSSSNRNVNTSNNNNSYNNNHINSNTNFNTSTNNNSTNNYNNFEELLRPKHSDGKSDIKAVMAKSAIASTDFIAASSDLNPNLSSIPSLSPSPITDLGRDKARKGALLHHASLDVDEAMMEAVPSSDSDSASEKDATRSRKEEETFSFPPSHTQLPSAFSSVETSSAPTPAFNSNGQHEQHYMHNHMGSLGRRYAETDVDAERPGLGRRDDASQFMQTRSSFHSSTALSMSQLRSSGGSGGAPQRPLIQSQHFARHLPPTSPSAPASTSTLRTGTGGGSRDNSSSSSSSSSNSTNTLNRLGRLGSDLNDLARKLDSFDASR